MDFKAVKKNIETRGFDYTIYRHLQRKLDKRGKLNPNKPRQTQTKERLLLETQIMLGSAYRINDDKAIDTLQNLFVRIGAASVEDVHNNRKFISDRIKSCESKKINEDLKALFIKKILPLVYKEACNAPIEHKIVFMTPRSGLNESCRYIYDRISNTTDYAVEFFEMKRISAPTAEMYLRAIEMTRSMATAEAIMTHVFHDFFDYIDFRPETKVIQLWHGCGIIKTLGMTNAGKPGHRSVASFMEYPEYRGYDLVTMPGEGERWIFADLMGISESNPVLQPIGISRTDVFFEKGYAESCRKKLKQCLPQAENKKIILYAPTYRGPDNNRYAPNELDHLLLKKQFAEQGYLLVIRHHGTIKDLPEIPHEASDFAYDMTKGSNMTINEWLTVSDIIVSDYSSVIYEFSLFERPIILFQYDYADYSKRGMYYTQDDLRKYVPVCNTNQELVDVLSKVNSHFNPSGVRAFKKRFMGGCDGHATDRIMTFIQNG